MTRLQAAFDLLGIAPDSDAATIKKAWRALVRSYHPDLARSDREAAGRRLAEINAAFDAVSACTETDRRRLAEEAAMRARQAETSRREREHRRRADRAAPGAAKASAAGADNPKHTRREPQPDTAASSRWAGFGDDPAMWHLARHAAQAFRTAQEVCARERRPEPRSAYF